MSLSPLTGWLGRFSMLVGPSGLERLRAARVAVFGLGGVGGAAAEALVRSGVGALTVVDHDTVAPSNLNRQLLATVSAVGLPKCEAFARRALDINPALRPDCRPVFADAGNIAGLLDPAPDYIIDAIDTVSAKVALAVYAAEHNLPIIACMGAGSRLDPSKLQFADLSKTHTCPLARVMRRELAARGVKHLDVLFSDEPPIKAALDADGRHVPGSCAFVPPVAGYMLAGFVVRKILQMEN